MIIYERGNAAKQFIYSTIAPARFMLSVFGVPVMGLNEGHFMMLGVGAIGALHYYQMPRNPKWYWDQIPRNPDWYKQWGRWLRDFYPTPLVNSENHKIWSESQTPKEAGIDPMNRMLGAEPKRFTWDPWVERLDKVHAFNKKWAASVGVMQSIDFLERMVRLAGSAGWRKNKANGDDSGAPLSGDIRTLIEMDGNLLKWLEQDPELSKALHEDSELRDLILRDPIFAELREKLLSDPE